MGHHLARLFLARGLPDQSLLVKKRRQTSQVWSSHILLIPKGIKLLVSSCRDISRIVRKPSNKIRTAEVSVLAPSENTAMDNRSLKPAGANRPPVRREREILAPRTMTVLKMTTTKRVREDRKGPKRQHRNQLIIKRSRVCSARSLHQNTGAAIGTIEKGSEMSNST